MSESNIITPNEEQKQHKLIRRNIGSTTICKGEVREGVQLVAWDCIQDCDPAMCPLGQDCDFVGKSHSANSKCALQTEYIQSFIDVVLKTFKYLDESDLYKVGMHLVPLYSQLCRHKILEKSVGQVAYIDHKGCPKIHPVYKEIRETIRIISGLWKDMGVTSMPDPTLPRVADNKGFGDPNHYARLIEGAENKRNVTR